VSVGGVLLLDFSLALPGGGGGGRREVGDKIPRSRR